jgi:hypothetical protein
MNALTIEDFIDNLPEVPSRLDYEGTPVVRFSAAPEDLEDAQPQGSANLAGSM